MDIKLLYKSFEIGKLSFNGNKYTYEKLGGYDGFSKEYAFLAFPLKNISKATYNEMPTFFLEVAIKVLHNPELTKKLNLDLDKDGYFGVLCKYATLPQRKDTFYFSLE